VVRLVRKSQAGVALVLVLLTMGVLAATSLGLVLSSTVTRLTATNYEESVALANASEAALELAARELAAVADWDLVLLGTHASMAVDGAPGPRSVTPDVSIDLVTLTNQLTCGRPTLCSDAQVRVTTRERPWGANNPRWRLFVHQFLPPPPLPTATPPVYTIVWLADDAAETDGDPLADGAGAAQEGRYMVRARAESFGPRGGRHAIEAEFVRVCDEEGASCVPGIRIQSWRAVANGVP
jgi:hypothetical protein